MKTAIFIVIACVAIACDTGDIYPEEFTYESRNITINKLSFDGVETIPNKREGSSYQYDRKLSLLAYPNGDRNSTPVVTVLQRENFTNNTQGTATINYASQEEVLVVLAITLHSNDIIYEYDSQTVGASAEDTEVDWSGGEVNLLDYERVQTQIYTQHCISCHGSNDGAGGLNLSDGYSFDATVGTKSKTTDSSKNLIEPSDLDNSILYHHLIDYEDGWHDHRALPYANDLELLKSWIENGAVE